jgi:pilus assembly protein CpaB
MERRERLRNFAIAGALALLAALLMSAWVSRAQGRAETKPAPTAPVLVATHDLPIGTSASAAFRDGRIAIRRLPAESISPAGMTSATSLRGQVVTQPIYAGEQVVASRFGRSGTQGLGASLAGALRAFQVPGEANQLLVGTLEPGDHVDVVANVKTNPSHPMSRVALRNLVVLRADEAPSSSSGGSTVTLQLTDKQAQVLLWVTKNADWSFVLRPSSGAKSTAAAPTTQSDVLAGS